MIFGIGRLLRTTPVKFFSPLLSGTTTPSDFGLNLRRVRVIPVPFENPLVVSLHLRAVLRDIVNGCLNVSRRQPKQTRDPVPMPTLFQVVHDVIHGDLGPIS
jgi:hypothetical protein